jgi:hypothetical protein
LATGSSRAPTPLVPDRSGDSVDRVSDRTLVIACGALAREIRVVLAQLGADVVAAAVDVEYLPASLHNRPELIPARVAATIDERGGDYERVAVAYADCGTGGLLDKVLDGRGIERLPGSHCYEFFAGELVFAALHDAEPGTFYLTDYLARHFEQLVYVGLGLDRHPQLRDAYFGNYTRLMLLSQSDDDALVTMGERAAQQLGLAFEHRHVGLAPFTGSVTRLVIGRAAPPTV